MMVRLTTNLATLCLLSTINCDTICDELQRNNQSIDYAYTKYNGINSIQSTKHVNTLVINDKVWNIRQIEDRIKIEITNNSEANGYEHFGNELIEHNYKIAVNVLDENRNIEIYLNDTSFFYFVRELGLNGIQEYNLTTNTNKYNIDVPFSRLSVAFIPDSFRSESDNEFTIIFVEQKPQNQSTFERIFYILRFGIIYINQPLIRLEDQNILPKFLSEFPNTHYINGILNTYDYSCRLNNNCLFSAIVLFTVNDSFKYCITSEDDLSENCKENLQSLIECDSKQTTSIPNETTNLTIGSTMETISTTIGITINPKEKRIIIIIIILIVCIIGCLYAYLIFRDCGKKQSKKLIVIKENKNTKTIEETKKNTKSKDEEEIKSEKELPLQSGIELNEQSQETFGFDTEEQKTLNLNEPIYVKKNKE